MKPELRRLLAAVLVYYREKLPLIKHNYHFRQLDLHNGICHLSITSMFWDYRYPGQNFDIDRLIYAEEKPEAYYENYYLAPTYKEWQTVERNIEVCILPRIAYLENILNKYNEQQAISFELKRSITADNKEVS